MDLDGQMSGQHTDLHLKGMVTKHAILKPDQEASALMQGQPGRCSNCSMNAITEWGGTVLRNERTRKSMLHPSPSLSVDSPLSPLKWEARGRCILHGESTVGNS